MLRSTYAWILSCFRRLNDLILKISLSLAHEFGLKMHFSIKHTLKFAIVYIGTYLQYFSQPPILYPPYIVGITRLGEFDPHKILL